jgi:hypothetical protein
MPDDHATYAYQTTHDPRTRALLREMDERNVAFNAQLNELEKPFGWKQVLGSVGIGVASFVLMAGLAAVILYFLLRPSG